MYPIEIIPKGDKVAADRYRKFGLQQMAILRKQLSFQKLNEGKRQVSPVMGVLISCESSYNTHEVTIYVDPAKQLQDRAERIALAMRRRKLKIEHEVLDKKVSYYVRLKYYDPEIDGFQDPDGTSGTYVSSLDMDRIIVWDMKFNSEESALADPTDSINRYNGFVPGGGKVIYDVDIVNEIVYVSQGNVSPDVVIAKFKQIALRLSTNINQAPAGSLKNPAADWFGTGRMENPATSEVASGGSMLPTEVEMKLSDKYVDYWMFNDPVPVEAEPEYSQALFDNWVAVWGANPDLYYTAYDWVGMSDVEDYYGTFMLSGYNPGTRVVIATVTCGDLGVGTTTGYVHEIYGGSGYLDTIVGGHFFTPYGSEGINSMFVVQVGPADGHPLGGMSWQFVVTWKFTYTEASVSIHNKIITPLESVQRKEFQESYSTDTARCSEMSGTIWEDFDTVVGSNRTGKGLNNSTCDRYGYFNPDCEPDLRAIALDHYGITESELGPKEGQFYKVMPQGEIDTHSLCNVHACNKKSSINIPEISTKFFSLFYFEERKGVSASSVCSDYSYVTAADPCLKAYYDPMFYDMLDHRCICNGTLYDSWEDATDNAGMFAEVGCIIYIFAPKQFYQESVSGDTTYDYWDIHSARRSEGIINPYRCLELEEYLLAIFKEKQQELDADPNTYKLNTDLGTSPAATMNYLGFGITNGFFETNIVLDNGNITWEEI